MQNRGGPAAVIGDGGCNDVLSHCQETSCREGCNPPVDPRARRRADAYITESDGKGFLWVIIIHGNPFFMGIYFEEDS